MSNLEVTKLYRNNLGEAREQEILAAVDKSMVTTANTPIDNPTPEYLAETTKIDISGLVFGNSYNSITDGTLTVEFSAPLTKLGPVPDGWATWSSPPFSEDANPDVLYAQTNTLELELSDYVSIFGFELEPSPFAAIEYTVEFFDGDELVETIARVVDGDAGARLFAREGDPINRVVITGGADFAIAQVRYLLASDEQFFILLVILLLIFLLLLILL